MSDNSTASGPAPTTPSAAGVRIRMFGRTDVGMVREHNEDNFLIVDLSQIDRSLRPEVREHDVGPRGTIFAVCDGMGGAAAGEVASQMAVDTIYELFTATPSFETRDHFAQRLSYAITEAGARIYLAAKSNRAQRGMGTTSTVAGVIGTTLFVGQVGDSRAYMVRGGKIKQITKDQSLVSKLIEAGQLTEAEAETFEHAHIILQALGTADTVSVDLTFVDLRKGDAVLICSDGLSGFVSGEQMREVLTSIDDPIECCKKLTDMANEAGGHDNITVIVARFDGGIPDPAGDDFYFGYQPYVIESPIEQAPAAKASGKIKDADAPPPGKDVKHAVSMRPPPASVPPPAVTPSAPAPAYARAAAAERGGTDDDDDISLPTGGPSRGLVAGILIVIALGLLAAAVFLLVKNGNASSNGAAGGNTSTPDSASARAPDVASASTPDAPSTTVLNVQPPSADAATAGATASDASAADASAADTSAGAASAATASSDGSSATAASSATPSSSTTPTSTADASTPHHRHRHTRDGE